ncbi:unnamed protein product, partial [Meganyctiphanes norvegica]
HWSISRHLQQVLHFGFKISRMNLLLSLLLLASVCSIQASGIEDSIGPCQKLGGRCVPSIRHCQDGIAKARCLAGKKCCVAQTVAEGQHHKETGKEKLFKTKTAGNKTKKMKNSNMSKKSKIEKKTRKLNKVKDTGKRTRKTKQRHGKNKGDKDNGTMTRKIKQGERNNKGHKG